MADKGDKSVGLINGTPKDISHNKMTASGGAARVWMIISIIFIAVSLALAGYLIYVKVFDKPATGLKVTEKEMIKNFPFLFRTPDEQTKFEFKYFAENAEDKLTPAANITEEFLTFCQFNCAPYGNFTKQKRSVGFRRSLMEWMTIYKTIHAMSKRDVSTPLGDPVYHGCCISRPYFVSPDTALTQTGQNCTLVQFNTRRQYFPSQVCRQAVGCTGCGCAQETSYISAVVYNKKYPDDSDDEYVLEIIKVPGCCKCFNNRQAA